MAPTEVYTFGYGGRTLKRFKEIVERLDAVVVDIRIVAWSKKQPEWTSLSMAQTFGYLYCSEKPGRYVHLKSFGNRNRFCGGPLELANWEYGLRLFERMPERPAVLVCCCRSLVNCHRGLVARLLREEGYRVSELVWPSRKKPPPEPPNLFNLPEAKSAKRRKGASRKKETADGAETD